MRLLFLIFSSVSSVSYQRIQRGSFLFLCFCLQLFLRPQLVFHRENSLSQLFLFYIQSTLSLASGPISISNIKTSHINLHTRVKWLPLLSNFKQDRNVSTNFNKIQNKIYHEEPSCRCYTVPCRRKETHKKKLLVAFRSCFAKVTAKGGDLPAV